MASYRSLSMPASLLPPTYTPPPKSRTSIPGRLGYRRLLFTLLTLHSIHFFSISKPSSSLFAEAAISCTYPNYLTEVKAGDTSVLSWQASDADISSYNSLTATLYCMDLNGPQGGMWRTIKTIFSNKGLVSTQGEVKFSVPNCGALANNAAIRIVALGQGSATQNDACYFQMDTKAAVNPLPTTTTTTTQAAVQPTTTVTKDPPVVTTNNPTGTLLPPTTPSGTTSTISGQLPTTATTLTNSSPSVMPTIVTTISGTVVSIPYPPTKPYPPLPPLPPLPEMPPSSSGGGNGQTKTLLASICSAAALVIIVSLLVLRRRRSMRHSGRGINGSHGAKLPHLKLLRNRSKSDQKEGRFHLMDDDDDYNNPEIDQQVAAAASKNLQRSPTQIQPPPEPVLIDLSEPVEKSDPQSASHRDSSLSYPPTAHLDPTWRRSTSFPYDYADDEYTMSSMRSSCETSSVVREYWAASMAARTERRLEGYPPTIDFYDEGSVFGDQQRRTPSFSSMSRKAEILTLDSASIAESNVLPAEDGFLKRHYRDTMNSVQSYLQRSMTMSLSSLHSTFTSSSEEENSSVGGGGGVGYAPRSRGTGFRPPIDSEFLSHLNIKSLRSEERQLEYYTHLYRQNPTMTMSTVNYDDGYDAPAASIVTSADNDSWRTSSVPSLTSTNDPFKTFDSNEILLDMDPFADQHAISFLPLPSPSSSGGRPLSSGSSSTERNPATVAGSGSGSIDTTPTNSRALMVVNISSPSLVVNAEEDGRSNSTLLGSFPIPPPITSESVLVRSSSGHSSSTTRSS
ncbi:hypothetical protein EC957_004352 [Mortierella hygrophila]|uniref:Uncharacterized protein n=1 Tax=Mortierella hygrophila TaxID=979708 RepID=A0A9P6F0Z4_9FUNG|nr:hypothetical protein EC957_004352 [Mortierella hygrophila]